MTPGFEHVIVIGASAGGVNALLELSASLPADFPAPVCIVQHIGSFPSVLPDLLRFRGPNPAVHVEDGDRLSAGTLHVAPPDRHLLVLGDRLQLRHGPKENHARPAIDPLFRSAARHWGPRAIGVVLTGQMDDGTAGLKAIKDCGGVTVVQDPADAVEPEMPESALANVGVDHCVPLRELGPLLARLAGTPSAVPQVVVPENVVREVAINQGAANVENLEHIATPSPLTCPDCGGGLWEMNDAPPLRYRCHTGHAFTVRSLQRAQEEGAEHALWNSMRALRVREMLLRRLAHVAAATGDRAQAAAGEAQADRLRAQIGALQELTEGAPPASQMDDTA